MGIPAKARATRGPAMAKKPKAAAVPSFPPAARASSPPLGGMTDAELAAASKPVKRLEDKWLLIPEYLRVKGLVRQHIESYNYFLNHQMKKIVTTNNEVKSTVDPKFFVRYVDVRIGTPSIEVQYEKQDLTPNQCRLQDLTYAAPIYVDVHYRRLRWRAHMCAH